MRCYVLMGVSGCGKSSVGLALSVTCGMTFIDGDDLHPQANIKKMSCGKPLNDKDRSPWLSDVGRTLAKGSRPIVIGCSALKKNYRDIIRSKVQEPVHFLHLDAPQDVLVRRIAVALITLCPPHYWTVSLESSSAWKAMNGAVRLILLKPTQT